MRLHSAHISLARAKQELLFPHHVPVNVHNVLCANLRLKALHLKELDYLRICCEKVLHIPSVLYAQGPIVLAHLVQLLALELFLQEGLQLRDHLADVLAVHLHLATFIDDDCHIERVTQRMVILAEDQLLLSVLRSPRSPPKAGSQAPAWHLHNTVAEHRRHDAEPVASVVACWKYRLLHSVAFVAKLLEPSDIFCLKSILQQLVQDIQDCIILAAADVCANLDVT
mmetsp:Transcript_67467/g.161877  ORF Transcript_67467/g.161877 Transcript_67467/m.161877 type:complete len:226 (+) Transcript_67467:1570-2247(+)